MKQLTILLIALGFIFMSDLSQAQTKKKKSTVHKSQFAEWKDARNGASLSVKWTMRVGLIFSNYATANLYSKDNKHSSCWVRLYGSDNAIHQDDIIIVTGYASGVSDDGAVEIILVDKIVNKGVE